MENRKVNKIKADIEKITTNENGSLKRLPSDFFYDEIKFNDYEVHGTSKHQMICATYDCNSDLHIFTEIILCHTPNLLLQMLDLKGKLSNTPFEWLGKQYSKEFISDKDLNLIIKWCKKNGYPFKPTVQKTNNLKFSLLIQSDYKNTIGFYVWDFIYHLNEIYCAFLLYLMITKQGKLPKETVYISLPPEIDNTDWRERKFVKLQNIKDDNYYSKLFESKYQEITYTTQISIKDDIHLEVKTENLFDAAFYQLANLLDSPESQIKICPICKNYFETQNAKQKYCLSLNKNGKRTCYSQKSYKRNKAIKKRGEQR